jgi:hypothetical protein
VARSLAAIECGVHQRWLPVDQAPKPKTEPYFYVDRDGTIPLSAPDAFTPLRRLDDDSPKRRFINARLSGR